jgi:hypothetical protein
VYGESPNQTDGRTARIAAVTAIGKRAQPRLLALVTVEQPAWRMRIVRAAAPSRMTS